MTATERLLAHFDRISEAPDAISRFRRFVLDLAVRGKLVEQDPSDEPASELAEQIQAEKRAIGVRASSKVTIPDEIELPFPAPDGWEWVRIGQVTSDRGQVIPSEPFTYIDVTSVDKEVGRIADPKVLLAAEAPSRARKSTQKGDVLYSCVRPYLLNVAVIDRDFTPPPIASTAFAVLNGFGLVVPRTLWIALRSPAMVTQVESKMRGQAYPAINDSDFKALPLPLPPLAEQHRIVAKVNELMTLCDRLEAAQKARESRRDQLVGATLARLRAAESSPSLGKYTHFALRELPALTARVDLLQEFRQALLDLAFQGKLTARWRDDQESSETASERFLAILSTRRQSIAGRRPAKPLTISSEDLPPIPGSWTWSSCDAVCSQITDGEHIQPPYQPSGVPMLTAKHVRDGYVTFDGCQMISKADFAKCATRCKPEKGDILIVSVGATTGRAAIVTQSDPFALVRSVLLLKPLVSAPFLLRWLQSPWCLDWMRHASEASAQPHLYIGDTKRMPVPIPSAAEQDQIVAKVDEMMAVCDHIGTQLEAGRAARGALLEVTLRDVLTGPELVRSQ